MRCRPRDASGDILPVTAPVDLLTGPEAAAAVLSDHLHLLSGEWWENPSSGNEILDLLSDARGTDREAETLTSYLVSYIRTDPRVRSITDSRGSFSGRTFFFSCTAHTDDGESAVTFNA